MKIVNRVNSGGAVITDYFSTCYRRRAHLTLRYVVLTVVIWLLPAAVPPMAATASPLFARGIYGDP